MIWFSLCSQNYQSTPAVLGIKHTSPTHYQAPWAVLIPASRNSSMGSTPKSPSRRSSRNRSRSGSPTRAILNRSMGRNHHQDEALTRVETETDLWSGSPSRRSSHHSSRNRYPFFKIWLDKAHTTSKSGSGYSYLLF